MHELPAVTKTDGDRRVMPLAYLSSDWIGKVGWQRESWNE